MILAERCPRPIAQASPSQTAAATDAASATGSRRSAMTEVHWASVYRRFRLTSLARTFGPKSPGRSAVKPKEERCE